MNFYFFNDIIGQLTFYSYPSSSRPSLLQIYVVAFCWWGELALEGREPGPWPERRGEGSLQVCLVCGLVRGRQELPRSGGKEKWEEGFQGLASPQPLVPLVPYTLCYVRRIIAGYWCLGRILPNFLWLESQKPSFLLGVQLPTKIKHYIGFYDSSQIFSP